MGAETVQASRIFNTVGFPSQVRTSMFGTGEANLGGKGRENVMGGIYDRAY